MPPLWRCAVPQRSNTTAQLSENAGGGNQGDVDGEAAYADTKWDEEG